MLSLKSGIGTTCDTVKRAWVANQNCINAIIACRHLALKATWRKQNGRLLPCSTLDTACSRGCFPEQSLASRIAEVIYEGWLESTNSGGPFDSFESTHHTSNENRYWAGRSRAKVSHRRRVSFSHFFSFSLIYLSLLFSYILCFRALILAIIYDFCRMNGYVYDWVHPRGWFCVRLIPS